MLFILAVDVLNSLVNYAAEMNLPQPLPVQRSQAQGFFLCRRVVFLQHSSVDLHTIMLVLQIFGHASGLKSQDKHEKKFSDTHSMFRGGFSSHPHLSCAVKDFPCTYEFFLFLA